MGDSEKFHKTVDRPDTQIYGARFVTLDQITLIEKQIIVGNIRIQREKLASSIEIGSDRLISFSASKKPGLKIGDFLTGSF